MGIILSIICIFFYIKNIKDLKTNYNKYLKVKLYFNNYKYYSLEKVLCLDFVL